MLSPSLHTHHDADEVMVEKEMVKAGRNIGHDCSNDEGRGKVIF